MADMKLIKGEVSRIKHFNPETGFCVFVIRVLRDGKISNLTMSCAGNSDDQPIEGSMVEVYGTISSDSKWGPQMKYCAYHVTAGFSSHSVAKYIQSFAKYLGPEKANAIAMKHGTDLEEILDTDPDRLLAIPGIGTLILANIVEGWRQNRSMHTIKMFLSSIGLPDYKIKEITSKHGVDFDSMVKEDPYVLMYEGIGFSICDEIARKLKISPQSEIRVRGLIMDSVRRSTVTGDGHLFVTKSKISTDINIFNSEQPDQNKIDPVSVTWDEIEPSLMDLVENGHLVLDGDNVYMVDHYFYESKSAEILSELLNTPGEAKLSDSDPDELVAYYQKHEQLKIASFEFSPKQADAIKSFVKFKVSVVTGPPGTGKTTIIKTFVRILDNAKVSYSLLAPTGIASKRLEQTSNKPASTIHRHLGYKGTHWVKNGANRLEESVIIVDEVSMVSMDIFYRLISALRENAHIVLVGDVFQLPSVGAGNVLKDLIKSGRIPTVMLDTVHRQSEQSDIVLASNRIKDGDTNLDLFKNDISADICFVRTNDDIAAGEDAIRKVCQSLEKARNITYQVITPRNSGDLSVDSLNQILQEELNPPGKYKHQGSVDQIALSKEVFIRPGDKVMIIKNNYNLNVFNGDVGTIRLITAEVVRIDLLSGDSVALPISDARTILKLAYAATVHKVQGTEFSVCVIPLLKSHGNMLLQRNLLYTAITRARKKVVIVGQATAIEAAILNAEIRNRNTNLAEKIRACCDNYSPNSSVYTRKLYDIPPTARNFKMVNNLLNPSSGVSREY